MKKNSNIGLASHYKDDANIQLSTCMNVFNLGPYSAWRHRLDIDIMENTLENDKLKIFYDYFVEQ